MIEGFFSKMTKQMLGGIRVEIKKELDEMCAEMGMNLSTFYMIYTKRALRDRKIPFDIEAPVDPFYSKSNVDEGNPANPI